MNAISSFIVEYKIFFIVGGVALCAFFFLSASLRGNVKKGIIAVIVIVAVGMGYFLITGRSALDIPKDLNAFFSKSPTTLESSHTYYRDPEERSENRE